jgi:hypothetical protein
MFSIRNVAASSSPTSDEIRRQRIVQRIVLGERYPITLFEKKAAAISRQKFIDVVLTAKIAKSLNSVCELFRDEADLYETETKNNILAFLDTVRIEDGDALRLPLKLPIFAQPSSFIDDNKSPNEFNFQLEPISNVNLLEFEYLCFKNRTLFKYYADTSFAVYVYQNLLYSLNVTDVKSLYEEDEEKDNNDNNNNNNNDDDNDDAWRKRFLLLLYETNVNESVAYNAFYDDSVIYKNLEYDSSFVPKYDVKKLIPVTEIVATSTDQYMIDYYYSIDISKQHEIPEQNIGIFLTFPFKNGYYVYPNGTVMYANVPKLRKRSVITSISAICDVSDIEAAVDSVARRITKDDALSYAVYAKNLIHQAVALMVLRRICGNYVDVPSLNANVRLPNEYDILSWTRISCYRQATSSSQKGRILLPVNFKSPTGESNANLVRDIAASCATKIGATILCSRYRIPEIDLHYVFTRLSSDAELYVFYTLLLQDYSNFSYHAARYKLNPIFGQDTSIDLSSYEVSKRSFNDHDLRDVNERLNSIVEPLLSSSQSNNRVYPNCSPYKCPNLYEFTNPKLRDLVAREDTELDDYQFASFIALCVQRRQQ